MLLMKYCFVVTFPTLLFVLVFRKKLKHDGISGDVDRSFSKEVLK